MNCCVTIFLTKSKRCSPTAAAPTARSEGAFFSVSNDGISSQLGRRRRRRSVYLRSLAEEEERCEHDFEHFECSLALGDLCRFYSLSSSAAKSHTFAETSAFVLKKIQIFFRFSLLRESRRVETWQCASLVRNRRIPRSLRP